MHYPEEALVEMRVICERSRTARGNAGCTALIATPAAHRAGAAADAHRAFRRPRNLPSDRPRINLGREKEVVDSLGRAIRRNELSFPEVSARSQPERFALARAHRFRRARPANGASSTTAVRSGPVVFRDGRRIDVPAHASRGVALRPGDEIYLGQVRLRFESVA